MTDTPIQRYSLVDPVDGSRLDDDTAADGDRAHPAAKVVHGLSREILGAWLEMSASAGEVPGPAGGM